MRAHTRGFHRDRTRHVFATNNITARVDQYRCGATLTLTADDGATVTAEFIASDRDGATMADRIMIALRDATRIDSRHLEDL